MTTSEKQKSLETKTSNQPLSIDYTRRYFKDLELVKARNLSIEKLDKVIKDLADNKVLEPKYRDHQLKGKLKEYRECHIEPDWLLMYRKDKNRLVLVLVRTGTHDEILR
jgi:mRNA interferase YafQ